LNWRLSHIVEHALADLSAEWSGHEGVPHTLATSNEAGLRCGVHRQCTELRPRQPFGTSRDIRHLCDQIYDVCGRYSMDASVYIWFASNMPGATPWAYFCCYCTRNGSPGVNTNTLTLLSGSIVTYLNSMRVESCPLGRGKSSVATGAHLRAIA
jgi:hypothetical protein